MLVVLFLNASVFAEEPQLLRGVVVSELVVDLPVKVGGQVSHLNVKPGQSFRRGEVLAKVDCRLYEATQEQITAQRSYLNTKSTIIQKLRVQGAASELQVAEVEAALANSVIDLKIASINVESCQIKAPFDGVVDARLKSQFEYVHPGDALFRLVSLEPQSLKVLVSLPSNMISIDLMQTSFAFSPDEISGTFDLSLDRSAQTIDPKNQSVEVWLSSQEGLRGLIPGMSGDLAVGVP